MKTRISGRNVEFVFITIMLIWWIRLTNKEPSDTAVIADSKVFIAKKHVSTLACLPNMM
jgi:hypothetical protein